MKSRRTRFSDVCGTRDKDTVKNNMKENEKMNHREHRDSEDTKKQFRVKSRE